MSRDLERRRQVMTRLRAAVALQRAAALEITRLVDVALDAGVPVDAVVATVDDGHINLFLERHPGETEREAIRRAVSIVRGRVVNVVARKLRDGRDCAPAGRSKLNGDLGQPVWRVEIERRAA